MYKLGILGCGKMAQAMLDRWLTQAALPRAQVIACTSRADTAAHVAQQFQIAAICDAQALVRQAEIVLLGIKPQQMLDVLPRIAFDFRPQQLVVSLLAAKTIEQIQEFLPPHQPVTRCMPNTPVRVGLGVMGVVHNLNVSHAQRHEIQMLLQVLGLVVPLDERQMDAFTAIAGSGPAYQLLFIEALAQAAENLGFDHKTALMLAVHTAHGTTALAAADDREPAVLRAEVTSKGGMTAAAIAAFERTDWRHTVTLAARAAVARAQEMAQPAAPGATL